ncbi:hypothetical protein IV203_038274 [Nitzschia inconspicua]|uniref:Uncharacterized protein n=1 Tax=Nitzschia inconspicua TaxID=303405 RepID=A0A9K3LR45_9STRA|nr:hypothetical protein IV203_038274 [Nitzschia inconspicua]
MILVSGVKIVTSAFAVALATQCARNMIQAVVIVRSSNSVPILTNSSDICITSAGSSTNGVFDDATSASLPAAVIVLQGMKRKHLLNLFCQSRPPSNAEWLIGDWEGCLLDNNSAMMNFVSSILTHMFFGISYGRWNGKTFSTNSKGTNRFLPAVDKVASGTDTSRITERHKFHFSLQPSRLHPDTSSIQLRYSKHHPWNSPWHTMMDEIREVPGHPDVLIGIGCVAWGGGFLNGAPFCLWRKEQED